MIKQLINKIVGKIIPNESKEGTVKFFNRAKRFGFIKVNDTDEEIFVHANNLIDKIKQNDKVKFEVEKSDKGLIAVNVTKIK